ncbi:MAG: hypothetical protein V3W18_08795 [candidate division Zixibacteria bacterium]
MRFWRKKKKCPVCGQQMIRKRHGHICPECGTRIIGDTQIRPKITGEDIMRIWR